MLAPRESENRQTTKDFNFNFFFSSPKKGAQKRNEKTNIKALEQKKKEETKNVCLFNWPFAGNRKKKATTSLQAHVCSFLVLTKMKKQKTFAFAC